MSYKGETFCVMGGVIFYCYNAESLCTCHKAE